MAQPGFREYWSVVGNDRVLMNFDTFAEALGYVMALKEQAERGQGGLARVLIVCSTVIGEYKANHKGELILQDVTAPEGGRR